MPYQAVKDGKLKAARIGSGRNLLFCREWIDEWLVASAKPSALESTRRDAAWKRESATCEAALAGRLC